MRCLIALVTVWIATVFLATAGDGVHVVICAPGYPSDTEQAQETMDRLAAVVQQAAEVGTVTAEYHSTLEGGVDALAAGTNTMAIVPLPFFLKYRRRFDLRPVARVVQEVGPSEVWTLVARRDAVRTPADLSGWRIAGMPGYAPRFISSIALADYGALPEDVTIDFDPRVLSVLRKAARGDPVAAILDGPQSKALESLPFAGELEVLASSEPLAGVLLCSVGDQPADDDVQKVARAFLLLDELDEGLLNTMRIARFEPLAAGALAAVVRAYDGSEHAAP